VSELTDDLSPAGDPLVKVTRLLDSQQFESWTWNDVFQQWLGADFTIVPGRGYEFVTIVDTTWNPAEYTNGFAGERQQSVMAMNSSWSSRQRTEVPDSMRC
jgi:hypothetical protein